MKCSIENCPGEYQEHLISQVFTRHGESIVIENIPAKVCDLCGDTVLDWAAVERLWQTLDMQQTLKSYSPLLPPTVDSLLHGATLAADRASASSSHLRLTWK